LPQFANGSGDAGSYGELSIGEHMYSQAQQTYTYLKRKVEAGELAMSADALKPGSFGYARPKTPAGS
jgi:hypothetical protein